MGDSKFHTAIGKVVLEWLKTIAVVVRRCVKPVRSCCRQLVVSYRVHWFEWKQWDIQGLLIPCMRICSSLVFVSTRQRILIPVSNPKCVKWQTMANYENIPQIWSPAYAKRSKKQKSKQPEQAGMHVSFVREPNLARYLRETQICSTYEMSGIWSVNVQLGKRQQGGKIWGKLSNTMQCYSRILCNEQIVPIRSGFWWVCVIRVLDLPKKWKKKQNETRNPRRSAEKQICTIMPQIENDMSNSSSMSSFTFHAIAKPTQAFSQRWEVQNQLDTRCT